jgi:ferredoxin
MEEAVTVRVVDRADFDGLFDVLVDLGYTPIGPSAIDGAIRYTEVRSVADLPVGRSDVQDGGSYRLTERDDDALFGYAVGPDSWKRYLFPPQTTLIEISWADGSPLLASSGDRPPRFAFIAVRPCELAAIEVQDRVFVDTDPTYTGRRRDALIIAANCTDPAGTCFCVSMGTGPETGSGYDLAFTELLDGDRHEFLFTTGSEAGSEVLDRLTSRPATPADSEAVTAAMERSSASMGRTMDTAGIRDLLIDNPDHPRWEKVADRCLSCANCTMACPTCFCSTVVDAVGFDGVATRSRHWDSCFTLDFSALHGNPVRHSTKSRYRQWMTHKLATWHDQFGVSGCVGCGRCITWCPVGIDITEEITAMQRDGVPS